MVERKNSNKQSFMIGVMTLFIAQLVVKILGLVYRLVITNIDGFGDAGNGIYGAGYQIYTLLLAISSIGVPNAISKLVSERLAVGKNKEAHEIYKSALLLFSSIGLIGSLLLFFFADTIAYFMGNPEIKGVMMVLSPGIFFVSIASVIRGYFNGMYNMKATSNSQIIEQVFKSVLTIIFVQLVASVSIINIPWTNKVLHITNENKTVAMAISGNAASTVSIIIGCIYLIYFYLKRRKSIIAPIKKSKEKYKKEKMTIIMKKILAISIPISIASIIAAVNRNIDTFTVMNGLKKALANSLTIRDATTEATRLFGILSGKIDMLVGLPTSLNIAFATALVPAISGAVANGDLKTAKRRLTFSIRTTLLIALPCMVGLFILANPILNLLFPNAYSPEATLLLRISSFSIIFTLLNQTLGGALQGFGKVHVPAISLTADAVIKLIMNLLLIPHIDWPIIGGIYGAAVSSVIASFISMLISIIFISKTINLRIDKIQAYIKPTIVSALMGLLSYFINSYLECRMNAKISILITLFISIVAYLIFLIWFKILEEEDFYMLPYGETFYKFLVRMKIVKP